jgi:hypothetical protein
MIIVRLSLPALAILVLFHSLAGASSLTNDVRNQSSLLRKTSWSHHEQSSSSTTAGVEGAAATLTIDSTLTISNKDQITIIGDVEITSKGSLIIDGDDPTMFVALNFEVAGLINLNFDEHGSSNHGYIFVENELIINQTTARLSIDASSLVLNNNNDDDDASSSTLEQQDDDNGERTIPLIRYSSLVGEFASNQVLIFDLDRSLSAELVHGAESIDLILRRIKRSSTASSSEHMEFPQAASLLFKAGSFHDTNVGYHLIHH